MFYCYFSRQLLAYTSLLTFAVLFSLREDGLINWSYWTVFLPIWIWKVVVLLGAVVGIGVWCHHPEARSG